MSDRDTFERAAQKGRSSLSGEFLHFLKTNKKWWLLPILVFMAIFGMLVLIGGSGLAPYIYTFF